jgi:ribosome biogenesis GTPase
MVKGIVIKTTGTFYSVITDNGTTVSCRIRGKVRLENSKSTSPAVVGDVVNIEKDKRSDDYFISCIHERKNHIVRKSINLSKQTHVIAANIDQAVLIVTLALPKTSLQFIDRYLVTCEAYRIPGILVFNKIDLYNKDLLTELKEYQSIYTQAGYPCYSVSAVTGEAMGDFRKLIENKTSLLSGHSGVGKSTLINAVEPGLKLKVQEISEYHQKGKHTTTFSEMLPLSGGGYIIDTPGIKGFGLVNINRKELFHFFPEMFRLTAQCQYYNCTHVHEPGCKIRQAMETGEISYSRYINYISMLESSEEKHR